MTKILLSLTIMLLGVSSGFAYENSTGMRDLAVKQMFAYGQMLYERGNAIEAKKVFTRILEYDPDFQDVQSYAKALGIIKITKPKEAPIPKIVIEKKIEPVIIDPNQDLKDQIAMEEQAITQLAKDVDFLRTDMQDQTHE